MPQSSATHSRIVRRLAAARLDATTLRFLVTGTSAAMLFFLLSWSLVAAGLPPFGGTLLAYAVVFALTYLTQQAWTFRGRARHADAFPRYAAAQAACGLSSALLARLLVGVFGWPPLPMAAVTTLASSAVSYVLSRYWVFSAASSEPKPPSRR